MQTFGARRGDFSRRNINWNTLESATHGADLLQSIKNKFLSQHVLNPPRFDAVVGLVLSSVPQMVGNLCVSERFGTSDHIIITFDLTCNVNVTNHKTSVRNFIKADYSAINSFLQDVS